MEIKILVDEEMFRFTSEQEWVNKAQSWFRNHPAKKYICIDSAGRVCEKGKEFIRATKESTYPIIVYRLAGL